MLNAQEGQEVLLTVGKHSAGIGCGVENAVGLLDEAGPMIPSVPSLVEVAYSTSKLFRQSSCSV